ncbi:MAG: oligopeptide/dipeptide ABC transporter ATP-binding protein [Candidatus Baldrarchaeia archaeon]
MENLNTHTRCLFYRLSPIPNPKLRERKRIILLGEPSNPINVPSGCRFHSSCPFATDICKKEEPELATIKGDRQVACHRVDYVEKVSEFEGFAG